MRIFVTEFSTLMKVMLYVLFILLLTSRLAAQSPAMPDKPAANVQASLCEGVMVAGYVDEGAYLNFTGPNINFKTKNSKFILGMLPSLRFKNDNSEPTHNSLVTPNLGAGLTYCYKHFAIQLASYYNAKTATKNGAWVVGGGIGIQLKK